MYESCGVTPDPWPFDTAFEREIISIVKNNHHNAQQNKGAQLATVTQYTRQLRTFLTVIHFLCLLPRTAQETKINLLIIKSTGTNFEP